MPNCFIYCRVSTEKQVDKGYSLETQEKLCCDFAERNDYAVAGVYRDEGKSATKIERPALQELLANCTTQSSSVDAVIIQETDRLARNTKDHLTIKAILRRMGTRVISIAQPMLDDSPEGTMVDTIIASVNQFQSDINGRKTKRGMQEKFDQGWWPCWAPLGYINASVGGNSADDRHATRVIKKDPEKWDLLKEGFQLYLTGTHSIADINDYLYERGLHSKYGKKMAQSTMTQVLKNPFYAGIMKWDNQERPGKHQPMITLEEHKRILQIKSIHNFHASRRRKYDFLLRGFLFCGICGQRYTADKHLVKKKDYYHCVLHGAHSNRNQNVEVVFMEREVEKQFKGIQFQEEYIHLIIDQLREIVFNQSVSLNSQKRSLCNRKKAIEVRRYKAEEKFFDGVITDDDFARIRTKLTDELAKIQARMEELDYKYKLDIDAVVKEAFNMSRNICKAYTEAEHMTKRHYLSLFWDRFIVRDKRITEAIPSKLILDQKGQTLGVETDKSKHSAELFAQLFLEQCQYNKRAHEES